MLQTILQRQLGMYPLIVLKDMQFSVLKSLIEFMYCGETSVTEDNLSALLQAAKFFQVSVWLKYSNITNTEMFYLHKSNHITSKWKGQSIWSCDYTNFFVTPFEATITSRPLYAVIIFFQDLKRDYQNLCVDEKFHCLYFTMKYC